MKQFREFENKASSLTLQLFQLFEPIKLNKMQFNKIQIITLSLMLLVLVFPALSHAQPGFDDEVNDVPVDGGLSLLVAAGVGYGAKKLRKKN